MMNRRDVLRGVGTATAGGVVTALGLTATSEEASAQAATTLDATGDKVVLAPDGAVSAVRVDADVDWAYDLPGGKSPSKVIVEVAAAKAASDTAPAVVASAESPQLFNEADGTESVSGDLISAGVLSAAGLTPDAGGEQATDVRLVARMRVENDDGDVLAKASASDTATVTVGRDDTDPSEYGNVGGSATLAIETV
jgi:hypothetical protein